MDNGNGSLKSFQLNNQNIGNVGSRLAAPPQVLTLEDLQQMNQTANQKQLGGQSIDQILQQQQQQ